MAAKSNAQLTTDIISVITGQTTPESITPITHGALEKDIVDSFWNKVDDPLNRTQVFADATARGLAVPDFIGQKGTQLDTNTDYISSGLVAGNWRLSANTQIQSDTYGVASGIDTYAITLRPALAAYAAGNSFRVLFTNANTGAASLQINGLAAKAIKKNGIIALVAGDIQAGTIYTLTFDGTNFQIDNSGYAASSFYKKYIAVLTQVATGAPIASILENTIGAIVFSRTGAGSYRATLSGAFVLGKTFAYGISTPSNVGFSIEHNSINLISFTTSTFGGVLSDDCLTNNAFEIRIYP